MEQNTFNLVKEEVQKNLHDVFELAWHNNMHTMIDWIVNNCTIKPGVILPRMASKLENSSNWLTAKEGSEEEAQKVSAQKVIAWAGLYHYAALCEVHTKHNWPAAKEVVKRFPEILNISINEGYRDIPLLQSFASNATEFYSVVTKYESYIKPEVYVDSLFSLNSVVTIKKALRLKKELFMKCLDLPCGKGKVPFKANLLKYGIVKINNEKLTVTIDDYFKLLKYEPRNYYYYGSRNSAPKKEIMDKIPSYINNLDSIKDMKDCFKLFKISFKSLNDHYKPFSRDNKALTEYHIIKNLVPIAQQSSCSIILTDFIEKVIKKIEKQIEQIKQTGYYRGVHEEEIKEIKASLSKRKLIEMIKE